MSIMAKHATLERHSLLLTISILDTVAIGGLVEIAPLFYLESTIEEVEGVRPYSPLELAGRNIYIREGCYNCHSQMVRPFRDEVERYGKHYSLAAESMYDHPFQWGSKRTGPDLARVGDRYSDEWHVARMINPRSVVPESIMPGYPFLATTKLRRRYRRPPIANQRVGVPYDAAMVENAEVSPGPGRSGRGRGGPPRPLPEGPGAELRRRSRADRARRDDRLSPDARHPGRLRCLQGREDLDDGSTDLSGRLRLRAQLGRVFLVMMFLVAVAYAIWPRNRGTFEKAARVPLEED